MGWILFEVLNAALYGSVRSPESLSQSDSEPAEIDLWITRQTYEFVLRRSGCGECGAAMGRKPSVVAVRERRGSFVTWQIVVDARCRGWRRHRCTALVTESGGELRFGALRTARRGA